MKEITWNLTNGAEAKVTVSLVLSKTTDADGDKIEVPCCEIEIIARVEGTDFFAMGRPQKHPKLPAGYTAVIGKLAIPRAKVDEINTAIAELEAGPEWQAKIAGIKRAEEAAREYDIHREKMRKIMGY